MSRKRPARRAGSATQPPWCAGATDEPAGSARASCPVQPERDVRVKRAPRGQITAAWPPPRCAASTRSQGSACLFALTYNTLRFLTVSA